MKLLSEAPIKSDTRVFVRCDIDVPIKNNTIGEKFRLDNLLETLKYIIDKGGIPVIAGHIGKPEGKYIEELSTKHLLSYFNKELGEGKFDLLENLRFDPREEENDENYAKELASKADMYVNESFATCHRKHSSIVGMGRYLQPYAGFRLIKEIESLNKVLSNPKRPLVVIIGGAKLESKMPVIDKFLEKADFVLLNSLLSANWSKEVTHNLILSCNKEVNTKDIDQETRSKFKEIIREAKTILWAGPLGMYEDDEFIAGTREIALEISKTTQEKDAFSIVGGGDTVAVINKLGLLSNFSFVSTGGSAMLQYLSNGTLPGIEALE